MVRKEHQQSLGLPESRRVAIEEAVKQAAWNHLRSPDAAAALSCYQLDAILASNGSLYPSFESPADRA